MAPVRVANMVAMPGSHRRTSRFDGEFKRAPKHTSDLEDAQNLGTGHGGDLRDAHGITQADTDLRRGETLLGELDDLLLDRVGLDAAPRRRGAAVRERRAGNALAAKTERTNKKLRDWNNGRTERRCKECTRWNACDPCLRKSSKIQNQRELSERGRAPQGCGEVKRQKAKRKNRERLRKAHTKNLRKRRFSEI